MSRMARRYQGVRAGQMLNMLKVHEKIAKPQAIISSNPETDNEHTTSKQQKIAASATRSLHGRHPAELNQSTASNKWLKRELFSETEAFMIAIQQDQVIDTLNYQKHIIQRSNLPTDLCRSCHETIQHIKGACQSLGQTDYKNRFDQVAAIIHQQLALKYLLIFIKLYWDRTIINNSDILLLPAVQSS
ncbi:hypothetical protein ACJJTC_007849 [Scirpophaga incertulas]